jgi:hypothetical protein
MNSRRMNRLEELGRVDAEKADTRKGKRNLRDEKSRIVRELKAKGGKVKKKKENPMKEDRAKEGKKAQYRKMGFGKMMDKGEIKFAKGGSALKPVKPSQKGLKKLPTKVRNKMGYMKKGGKVGMGKAMRGGGCVR